MLYRVQPIIQTDPPPTKALWAHDHHASHRSKQWRIDGPRAIDMNHGYYSAQRTFWILLRTIT